MRIPPPLAVLVTCVACQSQPRPKPPLPPAERGASARARALPYYVEDIQLLRSHVHLVLEAMQEFESPRLLIWGTGYDSKLWCNENTRGETVFIEDSPEWAAFSREQMDCQVSEITYTTQRKDYLDLLREPEELRLELPDELQGAKFDVMVVDGPMGFSDEKPGRMSSIFMSLQFAHDRSHIFVDDFFREVEHTYGYEYLAPRFGAPTVHGGRNGFAHFARRAPRPAQPAAPEP